MEHFLLLCPSFEIQRQDLLAGVSELLRSFVQIDTLPNNVLIECLLYGPRKASPADCIPAKILMENSGVFSVAIQNLFNSSFFKGTFTKELKAGDISSFFKKEDASMKKNYRPITVLPSVSKIYERLVQEIKCYLSSKVSCPHSFVDFERAMLRSMHCYVVWKPAKRQWTTEALQGLS